MNSIIKKYKNPIIYLITIIAILLIWLLLSKIINSSLILPSPVSSAKEILHFFKDSSFYLSLLFTTLRALLAFIISLIASFLLVFLVLNPNIKKAIDLIVSILRGIPTMAIILILIIWMKPSVTPVIVSMLALIPILYEELTTICLSFKDEYSPVISVYELKRTKIIKLFFKEKIASILDFSSSGIGYSLKLVISSEALSLAYYGLGSIMQFSKIYLEMERLFALAIIAVILGIILQLIVKLIKKGIKV